jgi:3'-phosphoadenosine 5'-phosphosulfate sulfotransferase (PAPS reductase)/FAD synthetase
MALDPFTTGEAVETMIAAGREVVRLATELFEPVAVVAAFSSGDDSMVSTHFAMSNLPECTVFNMDPMVGLEPSRCHLKAVCDRFRWPLEIRQAHAEGPPKNTRKSGKFAPFDPKVLPAGRWTDGDRYYEEWCLNFGFPGRGKPQHARMYQRLKERPLRRMLKTHGASKAKNKVLVISGVRHDESAVRAGYKRAFAEGYFGDVWVNPFYHQTAAHFEAYRQEFGLPRNPVKRACGISGECCCGTFGSGAERAAYRTVDPAFADYLDGLERRVVGNGFPWVWGESPPDWWKDERKGQGFLFDDLYDKPPGFQPACVGCNSGRR